jgi:hypothetical protein
MGGLSGTMPGRRCAGKRVCLRFCACRPDGAATSGAGNFDAEKRAKN